jgi:cell division protein FtsL
MSGPAAPARAGSRDAALPIRVRDAPVTRALRARTSAMLDALLAGRGWIALVGVLLAGIVFFNVDLLRMNREIAATAEKSTALKRENARLRERAALLGSSERIQDAAAELGMVLPGAGDVRYLKPHPAFDPRNAARRITEPNDLAALPAPVTTTPEPTAPAAVTTTPGTATTGTAAEGTVSPDPALAAPAGAASAPVEPVQPDQATTAEPTG